MYLPIPFTKPRKWMRVVVRGVEKRWFDDFGEFCTYVLKNVKIEEIIDEDELVWYIAKTMREMEVHPDDIEVLKDKIAETYGIAEEYVNSIVYQVRNWLILYEADLEDPDEAEIKKKIDVDIDKETFRQIVEDVARMYFELDYDRETIIKEIALTYGLDEKLARDVVGGAETKIFSAHQ